MRRLPGSILATVLACAIALGLTWMTLAGPPPVGAVHRGPWTAWPLLASQAADAYTRAWRSLSGVLPLEPGEGVELVAQADSDGRALDGSCRYQIGAVTALARVWTLTLGDFTGGQAGVPAPAPAIGSWMGRTPILTGPGLQAGQGLGTAAGPFALTLRLYGLPLAAQGDSLDRLPLPAIVPMDCR